MKHLGIFFLLFSGISLSGAEPNTELEVKTNAALGEEALLEEMDALWEKIGPHAGKGSKLAKDNRAMFDLYYRRLSKSLEREGGGSPEQEVFSLMCLPTAYGWPTARTLNKGVKYTGLFAVKTAGEYEVLVEVSPANSKANLVLAIDGKASDLPIKPNEKVVISLTAGVRALSIGTNDDVQLYFTKLHLNDVAEGAKGKSE